MLMMNSKTMMKFVLMPLFWFLSGTLLVPLFTNEFDSLGWHDVRIIGPILNGLYEFSETGSYLITLGFLGGLAVTGSTLIFWKTRNRRLIDNAWAHGLKNISVLHAGCAFAGINPKGYETSPKAKVIVGEIIAAGNAGLIPTSNQMDASSIRFRWMSPSDSLRYTVEEKFSLDTMLDVEELVHRFRSRGWDTEWSRKSK
jgi:hypothetical protein